MNRGIRWYDYITVNVYSLGLIVLVQTDGLVVPLMVQKFVGEEVQGAHFGSFRLWTLMVALLVTALMGMLSDHSSLPWGRRRPFIFLGTVAADVLIVIFIAGMMGTAGYWFLFVVAILITIARNTAGGAQAGLIPDLVPHDRRGRFSGVNTFFATPLPLIIFAFAVAPLIGNGQMWTAILLDLAVFTACMLLTMLAPEKRLLQAPPVNWGPILRLALMTAIFTAIILAAGAAVRGLSGLVVAGAR